MENYRIKSHDICIKAFYTYRLQLFKIVLRFIFLEIMFLKFLILNVNVKTQHSMFLAFWVLYVSWKFGALNNIKPFEFTLKSTHVFCSVIPRLELHINPKYNFSILTSDEINLQCTVRNPESLFDVTNGSLVWTKDGSALPGEMRNETFI